MQNKTLLLVSLLLASSVAVAESIVESAALQAAPANVTESAAAAGQVADTVGAAKAVMANPADAAVKVVTDKAVSEVKEAMPVAAPVTAAPDASAPATAAPVTAEPVKAAAEPAKKSKSKKHGKKHGKKHH